MNHTLSEKTEKGSVLITQNLNFQSGPTFFGDPMLTAALVYRLTYRSHILYMNLKSYRLKQRHKEGVKPAGSNLLLTSRGH
ncbi:MAG: ATP-binding protein [Firmicutes bacterium]|nr:ATP-binding protein [Bacillota bacterium]